MQTYLVLNVLPKVAEGMVRIAREKPDDPIDFLQRFLREAGAKAESDAVSDAKNEFYRLLAEAEGRVT